MDKSTNQKKKENEMNATLKNESFKQNAVLFAFTAPVAKQVSLAGDFNNWDSHAMPMRKGANGVWHLSVALKPGRYEYRFVADGVWHDDPAAKQRADNFLGGENSVKTIVG